MFVEIIYETGAKSVAFYESDEEMMEGLEAHHTRAKNGEAGRDGDNAHPAERIKEVQVYNKHPQDLNEDQTMSADVMAKEVQEAIKRLSQAGSVSITEVAAAVRDLSSPVVPLEGSKPHDSMFKMKAERVVKEGWDK